jgi:hypothetical protein
VKLGSVIVLFMAPLQVLVATLMLRTAHELVGNVGDETRRQSALMLVVFAVMDLTTGAGLPRGALRRGR